MWRTLPIAQVAEELGERPSVKNMGLVMKAATAISRRRRPAGRGCRRPSRRVCRRTPFRWVMPGYPSRMTRFGYTLMTEQSGPKDLVRYAVSAERAGFDSKCQATTSHPG